MVTNKTGFKASLLKIDNLIAAFERYHQKYPNAKFDDQVAILKHERAELVNKIGKLNLKEEVISEDLMTPVFKGDDITVNAALQAWTSLMQVFSSLESSVQDNINRLAIFDGFKQLIDQKTYAITQPAQTSMAAATAGTEPAPNASTPPMNVMSVDSSVPQVLPAPDSIPIEDEEEIESDEFKGQHEITPSTELAGPEVTFATGNPDDKSNDEADPDKKAVVDLTIEAKDETDGGGHITSFKEWLGIKPRETAIHARTLNDEDIMRIANVNEACLRGQALIQNIVAKEESSRRSLNRLEKKNISESTKRALQLAGILIKS